MYIDPSTATEDNPLVVVSMTKSQAEWVSHGLSDLLCWCRGYMAGRKDEDHGNDPMGTQEARELNIAIKRALCSVDKVTKN